MLQGGKSLIVIYLLLFSGVAAPVTDWNSAIRTISVRCALAVRIAMRHRPSPAFGASVCPPRFTARNVNGLAYPARYNGSMSQFTPNPTIDKLTNLAQRVGEAIAASPAGELEKNARQHFISQLAKQGLVTREEFDAQRALLEKTRAKLEALEEKIAALENKRA